MGTDAIYEAALEAEAKAAMEQPATDSPAVEDEGEIVDDPEYKAWDAWVERNKRERTC
jgi:hypothetical protein